MKHLLLFTIGPVQSFISQARKTHDLYAGSRLLSDLVVTAVAVVGEENLIFPELGEAMPNRFLAEVPGEINDLQGFAEKVEDAVRNEWTKVADNSLLGVGGKPNGFDEQIQNFLEIFWIIEPLDDSYLVTLEKLEKNLAAIKNVRSFRQFTWQNNFLGERGRKCNLDGHRNVQFFRSKLKQQKSVTQSPLYSTEGSVLVKSEFPEAVLQPGEGLSAVSFVKRRYQYNEIKSFKSTPEIALYDALKFLNKNDAGKILLKEYEEHIFSNFNAQLYYEDALNNDFFKEQGIKLLNGYTLEQVKKKKKELEKLSLFKFQKYYSILTFDGDDMGKWLSGENLVDKLKLQVFQKRFAECLADFAKNAKSILDQNYGQTVYAGGDDFMGFVNLNHLLLFLKELRILFKEKVNEPLSPFVMDKKISFSAGICIAHYKEPLPLVIHESKSAQERAKNMDGKDAFSISAIKGSGETHNTTIPFGADAQNVEKLIQVVMALLHEEFSNNFIKTLEREFWRVGNEDKAIYELMFQTELCRLLKRSSNLINKAEKKQVAEDTTKTLMDLYGNRKPSNFFQMLHIVDFLHRQIDIQKGFN